MTFTLRNYLNRPWNVHLGPAFHEPVHVPALGYVEVEGNAEDIDPGSLGGQMLKRKTLSLEEPEKAPKEPAPAPAQVAKEKIAEPIRNHPVTIPAATKALAPTPEKKG